MMSRLAVSSSVQRCWPVNGSPNPIHPMQMRETSKSLLPSRVYCIVIFSLWVIPPEFSAARSVWPRAPGHALLLGDFVGIPVGVADAAGINRRQQLKIAQPGRGLERKEVLFNGVAKETVSGVERLRRPGGEREKQFLPPSFAVEP